MKKFFIPLLVLFMAMAGALVWLYINVQAASGNTDFKYFLINKGLSAGEIGANLQKGGLIKSALAFKIYTQFTGLSQSIGTGEFKLSPSLTLFQTVNILTKGPVEIWVTIPEGLRREEIAAKFAKGLDRDQSFVSDFLSASGGDEGMLFPDTYLFPPDASASSIVNKMTKTFAAKTNSLVAGLDLTYNQRIILASILERETKTDEERPIVAGILINRLNLGMPLQVDATVQYALGTSGNWWPTIYQGDLSVNSPYNTYKFAGLPPGPISSPGLSSLKAAFNPSQTNYLYYIHDKNGQIYYAKTLDEQNANIAKYLQ